MAKKILLITIIGSVLSVAIYFFTRDDNVKIVSLGDGFSIGMTPYNIEGYSYNDYLKNDYKKIAKLDKYYELGSFGKTVKELIYEIKENESKIINGNTIEIQQAINEADILTIAIGMDELSEDKITRQIILDYEDDIKELLSMIKMLNHNQVIVLGLYTIKNSELKNIEILNSIIKKVCDENNFIFLDISKIVNKKEFYLDKNSYYINYLGHKEIYNGLKKYCKV